MMAKTARARAGGPAAERPRDDGIDGDRLRRQMQAREGKIRENLGLFAEEIAAEEARRARRRGPD